MKKERAWVRWEPALKAVLHEPTRSDGPSGRLQRYTGLRDCQWQAGCIWRGVRGFDPPQEVADPPQKVMQNLFGGRL